MSVFVPFPKIPRLFKDCTITEKIDGTNACIVIAPNWNPPEGNEPCIDASVFAHGVQYAVWAQSRNKVITPGKQTDNAGFAAWVDANSVALVETLGEGRHFGEWYGQGIQRGYGLDHKRFALFNTRRWQYEALEEVGIGLECVPVLYEGPFDTDHVDSAMSNLIIAGSRAVPGFMRPEGVMVYHHGSGTMFKAPFDPNPKGQ